jgi:hypothetical protein
MEERRQRHLTESTENELTQSKRKFFSVVGVLDEPDSAKPAQLSSRNGPPGYKGWTRFQPL